MGESLQGSQEKQFQQHQDLPWGQRHPILRWDWSLAIMAQEKEKINETD